MKTVTHETLDHSEPLRPELPDDREDVAALLGLDLLDQTAEGNVH